MNNKNLLDFGKFKNKKSSTNYINENVQAVDDVYRVRKRIDIPMSLVNAFKKKVKDESGKNISQFYSDVELAEEMAEYIIKSYVSIENLPVNLILGDQYSKSQGGGAQSQIQDFEGIDDTQPAQSQGMQGQPQGQPQGMQGQPQGAQKTAAQIPPTQGGQSI